MLSAHPVVRALLGASLVTALGLGWLFWPARPTRAAAVTPDGTCVLLDVSRAGRSARWAGAGAWLAAHSDVVFPEACDAAETPCPRGFVCTPYQECVPSPIPGPALWQACADAVGDEDVHFGAHPGWEHPGTSTGVPGAFARLRSAGDGAAPVTAWRRGRGAGQTYRYEVAADGRVRPLVEFQSDEPFFLMMLGLPLWGGAFVVLLVLGLVRRRSATPSDEPAAGPAA